MNARRTTVVSCAQRVLLFSSVMCPTQVCIDCVYVSRAHVTAGVHELFGKVRTWWSMYQKMIMLLKTSLSISGDHGCHSTREDNA